ncbi:MAG: thiamine pyrophosphate-dependent enzyme, partial [Acidimicrobiales bacterium]
ILAGPGSGDGDAVHAVASALGWPVLAAPQAPVWGVPGATIPAADAILRVAAAAVDLRPEIVLRLGAPLASRVVGEWVAATGAAEIVVAGAGVWIDPHGTASVVLPVDAGQLLAVWSDELPGVTAVDGGAWRASWERAGATAQSAVDAVLDGVAGPTEPGVARALVAALPLDATLVVSSSMPIRDLEWYVAPTRPLTVRANRGANGIDGVVSTAVGVAVATKRPTALLIGDVAFLHDSNGLLGAAERGIDLVVAVVDNDGGGIFSFLPQAGTVDEAVFERFYGTPHGVDLVALASAYGVHARAVDDVGAAFHEALGAGGVHVLVVRTDRTVNVELHRRVNGAVADALAG